MTRSSQPVVSIGGAAPSPADAQFMPHDPNQQLPQNSMDAQIFQEASFGLSGELASGHDIVIAGVSRGEKQGIPEGSQEPNQDASFVVPEANAFGVVDGMGGHRGGEVASQVVASTFADVLKSAQPTNVEEAKDALKLALDQARANIVARTGELAATGVNVNGMGATVAAGVIVGDKLVIANAGDSGVLVKRGGEMIPVTTEQGTGSTVYNVIDERDPKGVVEYDFADKPAIDEDDRKFVDEIISFDLEPGDRIVVVTDGVLGDTKSQRLEEHEYIEALADQDPENAAVKLISHSRKIDDTTAVVVDYDPQKAPDFSHLPPPPDAANKTQNPKNPNKLTSAEANIDKLQKQFDKISAELVQTELKHITGIKGVDADKLKALRKRHEVTLSHLRSSQRTWLENDPNSPVTDKDAIDELMDWSAAMVEAKHRTDLVSAARAQYVDFSAKFRTKNGLDPHFDAKTLRQIQKTYVTLRDAEGAVLAKSLVDNGYDLEKIRELGAFVAVEDAHQLQSDITQAWVERGPKTKTMQRFADWWVDQGGHKFLSAAGIKANIKRGAVMAGLAAGAGAATVPIFATLGLATGAATGAIIARSVARGFGKNILEKHGGKHARARHIANEDHEATAINIDKLANKQDRTITTEHIVEQATNRSMELMKANRRRLLGSVAIGVAGGLAGAWIADGFFHRWDWSPIQRTPDINTGGSPSTTKPSVETTTTTARPSTTSTTARPSTTTTSQPSTTTTARPSSTTTPSSTVPPSEGNGPATPNTAPPTPNANPASPNTSSQILGPDGKPYTQAELDRIFNSPEFKNMVENPQQFEQYANGVNAANTQRLSDVMSSPEFKNMVENPQQFERFVQGQVFNSKEFADMVNHPEQFTRFIGSVNQLHETYPHFEGPAFDRLVNETLHLAAVREQLLAQGMSEEEVEEVLSGYVTGAARAVATSPNFTG